MGPGVEYILRARDLLSGVLNNASKAAGNVSKSVDGVGKSTEKAMIQAEKSVNRVSQSWKGYIEKVKESNSETQSLASGIGRVVGTLAVLQGIKSIVKMGADLEQSTISFEVLLGSAQKAQIMLAGLNKFANETPYENKPLIDQAKLLLSFGTSAEKILPTLKMLGDIGMGDTNKMQSLTLAYAQMSSAGKLQGQDLLQMVNAGFNPLQIMAKNLSKKIGISQIEAYSRLRDQMEKGKISAQMVEDAFLQATSKGGMFFGMMERMSKTAAGQFTTLTGGLNQAGASLGLKLLPYVNTLLSILIPLSDWIGQNVDMLSQLANTVGIAVIAFYLITGAIKAWAVASQILAVITGKATIAQLMLNGALSFNPIGIVIIAITALIALLVVAWNKFAWFRGGVLGLWETFKLFGNFLKDAVMNTVHGLIDMFVGLGKIIDGIFHRDWGKIKDGAKQAGSGYVNSFAGGGIVKSAIENGSKVGKTWAKGYKNGVESFNKEEAAKQAEKKKSGINATNLLGGSSLAGDSATKAINTDDKIRSISSGGSKQTNITININKEMIGSYTVHVSTAKEGVDNMKDMVIQALSQIMNSSNRMALE